MASLLQYVICYSSFFTISVSCKTEKKQRKMLRLENVFKKIIERLNHEMDSELLSKENIDFVNNHLYFSLCGIKNLEDKTVEQSNSKIWFCEHRKRLTAIKFKSSQNKTFSTEACTLLCLIAPPIAFNNDPPHCENLCNSSPPPPPPPPPPILLVRPWNQSMFHS